MRPAITPRFIVAALFLIALSLPIQSWSTSLTIRTTERLSGQSSKISVDGFEQLSRVGRSASITSAVVSLSVDFPTGIRTEFQLRSMAISSPQARFLDVVGNATRSINMPDQNHFVGEDPAVPGSFVFLSIDAEGRANGVIDNPTGDDWYIATLPDQSATYLSALGSASEIPDDVPLCGLTASDFQRARESVSASLLNAGGPRLARVAIDADSLFLSIFPSSAAASSYISSLIAYISAVYERDLDVRLSLEQVRIFAGATPYPISDVGAFANYWENNEDTSLYDIVHLFTSSRDLPFGGIAFLSGTCSGAFGIDGFLLGSFPIGPPMNGRGLWDLVVTAHEMGHNLGTLHTHDGYTPSIDQCGSTGVVSVGTIMSYCHTVMGGELNIDLRMHRRVAAVIADQVRSDSCLAFDCNRNAVADELDISLGTSLDTNADGIPDECQDCNLNSILDAAEIRLGSVPDVNRNGVPDPCEADCNGNNLPDSYEIEQGSVEDFDGNFVPDQCDQSCGSNLIPDHQNLGAGLSNDLNRNRIPDECAVEDCDGNNVPDWIDMEMQGFLVAAYPGSDSIFEFHERSGALTGSTTHGLTNVIAMTVSPSRRVILLDADGRLKSTLLGGVALDITTVLGATDICMAGNLLVVADTASGGRLQLLQPTNGLSVASIPVSVNSVVQRPVAITLSSLGTLYVVTAERSILEYELTSSSISLLGERVASSQAGPLVTPSAIVVLSPSQIVVGCIGTSTLHEYNGVTGQYVGKFLRLGQSQAGVTELELGPNGYLFQSRIGSSRIVMIDPVLQRPVVNFVRGLESMAPSGTAGFAFMPFSENDCNRNGRLDACDISLGVSMDVNNDGRPDECSPIASCCIGSLGDNSCDGEVDILDLTALVDLLFISFQELCCAGEADLSPDGGVDILDVTVLVDHLFISFVPLGNCP